MNWSRASTVPTFSGIAVVDPRSGRVTSHVDSFADADTYQAAGEADASYAVWKEFHSLNGLDEFVVKMWDRTTGTVRQIGTSRQAPDGHTYPSPWQAPVLDGHHAAWVEGIDDDNGGELVLADLATDERKLIKSAHPGWLTFYDNTLIWAESPRRGARTVLHAIDVRTREPVELPPVLKDLRGAGFS